MPEGLPGGMFKLRFDWYIRLLGAKQHFSKEKLQLAKNLRSARCSPFVISKVFAARMRKLIIACARKNKRTARMLAKTI